MSELADTQARLRRFLRAHQGHFSLAIVLTQGLGKQDAVRQWVEGFCRELGDAFVAVDAQGLTAEELFNRLLGASEGAGVLLLTGLDAALAKPETGMAVVLNRQRERIGALLRGPVLLVVGELALDRLLVDAPDFADWHSALFRWDSQEEPPVRALEPERQAGSYLPQELLRRRAALLREQLAGDPPREIAAKIWSDLASALENAGEWQQAGEAAGKAVEMYRALGSPVTLELARALRVSGSIRMFSGTSSEATEPLQEGIGLGEQLVRQVVREPRLLPHQLLPQANAFL